MDGFTLGAFYGYYKTKEDLFYALTDETSEGFSAIMLSIAQETDKLPADRNTEAGLSMQLVIGDTAPFDGKQASGMFQGSAGYLAMVGKIDDADRMEKEGYYGEKFVLVVRH